MSQARTPNSSTPRRCRYIVPRAGGGDRTRDFHLGKVALYQLSYARNDGAVDRTRTGDTRLGRTVLYQLSYYREASTGGKYEGGGGSPRVLFPRSAASRLAPPTVAGVLPSL